MMLIDWIKQYMMMEIDENW